MSFEWKSYHQLAKKLLEENNEAAYRSAVSRAYYAAFNVLRLKAGYNTRPKKAELSHKAFISLLRNPTDNLIRELCAILRKAT